MDLRLVQSSNALTAAPKKPTTAQKMNSVVSAAAAYVVTACICISSIALSIWLVRLALNL